MRQSHVSCCVLCSSTVEDKRRKQLAREDGRGEGEQQEKGERQVTVNVAVPGRNYSICVYFNHIHAVSQNFM